MGSVFKKTFTKPLPDGAEIVLRKGQQIARWKAKDGKRRTGRVIIGKDGSKRVLLEAGTYTAKYRDGQGRVVEKTTGCRDESAARPLLAEWERRAEQIRAGVFTPGEDAIANHSQMALESHFEGYLDFLVAKATTEKRRTETLRCLKRVSNDCE
jgi:hypothetical protein